MNVIIFLTFAINYFALSGAEAQNDVEYRLGLGSLEVFLYRNIQEVPKCYEGKDAEYEKSLLTFSETIENIRNHVKSNYGRYIHYKYYMNDALKEMELIASSLKSYLVDLKAKILNWHLVEGGRMVWNQRNTLKTHYGQYLKHMGDVKTREDLYKGFGYLPENAFKNILTESDKLADKVLLCLEEQKVSLVKNKNP